MKMLERYLHAIEGWLPGDQRRDIVAEISEDLNSEIEEQQGVLGRNLTEGELEALLKRRGRPMLVASRYRPQQALIGPVWFPVYLFVLKMVGWCYVLPWGVVSFIVRRVQHPRVNWGLSLLAALSTLWTVALVAAGVVTLIFAMLQWSETRTHFLEDWNPRQLPPVRDPNRIPVSGSVVEVAANLAFLFWWIVYATPPFLFDGPTFKLTLAPVWAYFLWGYVAIGVFNIALAVFNLRNRSWTGLRATCRVALDLSGGALFCWMMKANLVSTLYVASLDSGATRDLRNAINLWMDHCFPFAVIVTVVILVIGVMRIVRVSRKERFALGKGVTV